MEEFICFFIQEIVKVHQISIFQRYHRKLYSNKDISS